VERITHVASPPPKPLMLYDGDCRFCTLWIHRWQTVTRDFVEYLPFQDVSVAARFPEIPREQFENAVQFIMPDGSVFSAAEAVFRSMACNPDEQWLLDLHQHSPVAAKISEVAYRFVARHRKLFSILTRLLWGQHLEPESQNLVRGIFLRGMGIVYLIAFVSLGTQIAGLVGSNGIAPAKPLMDSAKQQFDAQKIGLDRYHRLPTLCWFNASDGFLKFQCAAGTALAVLLLSGFAPAPCLFLLWLIYLSLTTVCGVFLGFQWDNLLLETGFLAIFFAPLQLLPRRPSRESPPSRLVLWLLRMLLFRLMFESGCVKLLSGDPTWRDWTALTFHYETQPLPTWIGWYAHQLPVWFQKFSCAAVLGMDLAIPFLIFLPRKPRQLACVVLTAQQVLIFLTGNYCFFNLLAILLCLTLLDDAAVQNLLPKKWRSASLNSQLSTLNSPRWPLVVTLPLLAAALCACYAHFFAFVGIHMPGPAPIISVYRWLQPFRTFNSYGLFAGMTTSRPEIVIEGSNDGVKWEPYEFKYKPGDVKRRPKFVEPHQPRLDWQMWFAALGDARQNPWLVNFCVRLLQGSSDVLDLLERNPFPNAPPRYVRAVLYDYHFTDLATRRATGEWWRREWKGIYLPPVALDHGTPQP